MSNKAPRVNYEIIDRNNPQLQVRLLSEDGEMLGVLHVKEALRMCEAKALDLIEVSPNANPPVCKMGDFGKIKYEMQKKLSEERKRNKVHDVKEVKFTINIAQNDYNFKLAHIKSFIESGFSVKISCMIRGRDRAHGKERLTPLFDKISEDIKEIVVISGKVTTRDNGGEFVVAPKIKK
jgi:translation initiation factor IF-3